MRPEPFASCCRQHPHAGANSVPVFKPLIFQVKPSLSHRSNRKRRQMQGFGIAKFYIFYLR